MFYEKGIATYIGKAVGASIAAILVAETVDTMRVAIKARKDYLKALKEDPEVPEEHYKDCKSGKKAKKLVLECIKEAARARVRRIKENPQQEIFLMFCMLYFWVGHYIGSVAGAKKGFKFGIEGIDKLLTTFGQNAPDEMKALVEKMREADGTTDIDLTGIEIDKFFGKTFRQIVKFSPYPREAGKGTFALIKETLDI